MLSALPSRLSRVLARRAGLRLFRLFARPLAGSSSSKGFGLRMIRKEEALALCGDAELDLRKEGVEQAFARGDLCVGAYDRATLAGYCWLAFAPLHHLDGVWAHFGPDAAWTYKSLVRPAYRGRGIAGMLYRFADPACLERGRIRSLLCVEAHNTPSIAAGLRAGYEPLGWAGWLRGQDALRAWHAARIQAAGVRFYLPREPEPVPAG